MATIKDIAKYANVAPSTVSYVLNDSKYVSPETRERIKEAIEYFNYIPNQLARSLKTKRTGIIGVIVPDISNLFFTEIVKAIENAMSVYHYNIILCSSSEDPKKEEKNLQILLSREVDGLILLGTGSRHLCLPEDFPVISVDRQIDPDFSSVQVDNKMGGYLATQYLLNKNCSHILMITSNLQTDTYEGRLSGFREALKTHNMIFDHDYVLQCPVSSMGGYESVNLAIKNGLRFDGVFAANDLIALGVIRALTFFGHRVPQEVRVIGYDDIVTAEYMVPALSTVRQPQREMGSIAATIMMNKINGCAKNVEHILLTPTLILRESA